MSATKRSRARGPKTDSPGGARVPRRRQTPTRPVSPDGREPDTLSTLLDPVAPDAFVSEYWGRRSLLIKGRSEKVRRLVPGGFDRSDFFRGVLEGARQRLKGYRVWAHQSTGFDVDSRETPGRPIAPEDAPAIFASESNIGVEQIGDARLANAAAALKTQLRHLGDAGVSATLSPRGFGLPIHLDGIEAFFLQCEGRKSFLISDEPAVTLPRGTIGFDPHGVVRRYEWDAEPWEECPSIDVSKLREVVLEPGDVLYVPAGGIHGTRALDQSLTALLFLQHASFLDLLTQVLKPSLVTDPNWRHLPRVGLATPSGALPPAVSDFFAARLAELRTLLDDLSPDSFTLNRQWHKMMADPGESVAANQQPACADASSRLLRRGEMLRLSRRSPLTYARGTDADGDEAFFLYCGDKELSVGGEWVPFLAALVEQGEFRAGAATGWAGDGNEYPWETVQEYLGVLLEQEIVERVR